jgi:chromosome segregation ATPase
MELQGAKVSVNDANTGQVIEFELVRVGTMREFRELVKAHEERSAELKEANADQLKRAHEFADLTKEFERTRDAADALKSHADNTDVRLAEMARERDEANAQVETFRKRTIAAEAEAGVLRGDLEIATLKIAGFQESAKTATMAVEGAAGARDAALAGVEEITQQRDEAKACLAEMTRQRDTALETIAGLQRENETREQDQFRDTGLLQKLEADKSALESLMAEIMGTIGRLRED